MPLQGELGREQVERVLQAHSGHLVQHLWVWAWRALGVGLDEAVEKQYLVLCPWQKVHRGETLTKQPQGGQGEDLILALWEPHWMQAELLLAAVEAADGE